MFEGYSASAHLVPDADVGPFGQQQLHLVYVLVFRCPDDGCPSSVILVRENDELRLRNIPNKSNGQKSVQLFENNLFHNEPVAHISGRTHTESLG